MYMLTTLFATSYCPDGGSGYHMAVAHSYCYELLVLVRYIFVNLTITGVCLCDITLLVGDKYAV